VPATEATVASETFARQATVFFFGHCPFGVKAAAPPGRGSGQLFRRRTNMPQFKIHRYLKHGTLPQLSVFEAVARLGSFTRAAEELYMAQPTVSVQIKKLTETIGLPLFEQVGKRVHLTEAGRELCTVCQDIFKRLDTAEDGFADIRGLNSGHLRLAVNTTAQYFVPRMLSAFALRHPGVEVSLQIHHRETLIARMAENADDLYIFTNLPTDVEIVTQMILPNPMVVFARADHPLAQQKMIPFERFTREPFLMREPGSGTRLVAQQVFAAHGACPQVRMELSTNEAIKQAILAGLGVSIMSRYTLGLDVEENKLVTLDVEGFPLAHHWYFVYPVGKQLPVAAKAFMDFVRENTKYPVPDHPPWNRPATQRGFDLSINA
jgi:DNA-binding transcriptional LysR family regulator